MNLGLFQLVKTTTFRRLERGFWAHQAYSGRTGEPLGLREQVSYQFLRGTGLEIGALHNPLPLPPGATARYVDRIGKAELLQHYPDLDKPLVEVDIIDDAETLGTVAAASQDFIVANHFLEHTQDPIGTIRRHLEVLRPGGILYLAVPDKRWTFDRKRPVTPLGHLYRDFEEGPAWSYEAHVEEFGRLVMDLEGEALAGFVAHVRKIGYSIHFHVFTRRELLALLLDIRDRLALPFEIATVCQNHSLAETILVLERT